jgi:hypothetical protein
MSIKLKITEKEILDKPNDAELGSYVRRKYLIQKETMKKNVDVLSLGQIPDDKPEKCLVCGKVLSSITNYKYHINSRKCMRNKGF